MTRLQGDDLAAGEIEAAPQREARATAEADQPASAEMKLIVDGLCLETLRFPAHLGDGTLETESESWLDITRLERAEDGGRHLREALLVALDWARDPDGNNRPEARQPLTLVVPTRHVSVDRFHVYTRELELFAALVLRDYRDVVAAIEIGNEDWVVNGAEDYAAKARMAISALTSAMDALDIDPAQRPDILLQMPLPPKPPMGRDDRPAAARASAQALQGALSARKAEVLHGTRAIATRYTAEDDVLEITAHEAEDRVVAYVRSRSDQPLAVDVDFTSLLAGALARGRALRIGAAPAEAGRPAAPRAFQHGNAMRLAQTAPSADPWVLSDVEMDGGLLDVELAPFEAVEVTFELGGGGVSARPSMQLLEGGKTGAARQRRALQDTAHTLPAERLVGAPACDEVMGWVGAQRLVFGQTATGPVVRDFQPGQDVVELVLPGLSVRDIALADHEDGVMVQAGETARFLLGGIPSARQIDLQRDFRVL